MCEAFQARYITVARSGCIQVAVQESIKHKIPWACLDFCRVQGQLLGLRVINMAGYSAYVCYAIEEVLMRPMGIYNGESQIAQHPMPQTSNPTLDAAPRFECHTEERRIVPR